MEEEKIYFPTTKEWRNWLSKNHDKRKIISVLCYRKHTGKPTPSHQELMHEAICYGWIDTTLKKLDEDRYVRRFARRSANSKWSYNTLKYGKMLIKEGRMSEAGLKFYKEGLKKLPHDHGIPKNPGIPRDLKSALGKNKKAKENFKNLAPSTRRMYLRWLFRAKGIETRKKRINIIVGAVRDKKRIF